MGNSGKSPTGPRPRPVLNERIMSSMSEKQTAAHPWHDVEIGMLITSIIFELYLLIQKHVMFLLFCHRRAWSSKDI